MFKVRTRSHIAYRQGWGFTLVELLRNLQFVIGPARVVRGQDS